MTYTIEEIYRVVCEENYQQVIPETHWTKSKKECEDYIAQSYYKHCLSIEKSTLTDKAVKIR